MRYRKLATMDGSGTVAFDDDSRWTCEYKGQTIDVDLMEVAPDRWAINVSVRIADWSEDLRFVTREAARAAGERLAKAYLDEIG